MNFLKKKRSIEPVVKVAGKIVITDFDELNPADFPYNDLSDGIEAQTALLSCDGRLFVNSGREECEYIASLFEILIRESRYNLDQFAKIYRKQYPNVTLSNWNEMQGSDEERTQVLAALLIPKEIIRRQVERAYYSRK